MSNTEVSNGAAAAAAERTAPMEGAERQRGVARSPRDPEGAAVQRLDKLVEDAAALSTAPDFAAVGQCFRNTLRVANAVAAIKRALTPEVMKPILELQNTRLGFLTDSKSGYPEETVKSAIIEAAFRGLAPYGNQFNVISGRCYVTKEGMNTLLGRVRGLKKWGFETSVPALNGQKAECSVLIEWLMEGEKEIHSETRRFPVRVNMGMGDDAIMGKAERKAAGWLLKRLTGIDAVDGDASEAPGGRRMVDVTPAPGGVAAAARDASVQRAKAAIEGAREPQFAPGGEALALEMPPQPREPEPDRA